MLPNLAIIHPAGDNWRNSDLQSISFLKNSFGKLPRSSWTYIWFRYLILGEILNTMKSKCFLFFGKVWDLDGLALSWYWLCVPHPQPSMFYLIFWPEHEWTIGLDDANATGKDQDLHLLSKSSETHCCSVAKLCLTLPKTVDCSTPGFPVPHHLSLPKFMSTESVMPSTVSLSVTLFSFCLQSYSASGSFQVSQLFTSGGWNIGASASASVLPMNIQEWFPLRLSGLISLLSKGLSRVFSSTTVQKHQFFGALPSLLSSSHICTWLL